MLQTKHHSVYLSPRLNLGIRSSPEAAVARHSSGSRAAKVAHFLENVYFCENKSQRKCTIVVQLSVMHFTDSVITALPLCTVES